MCIAHKFGRASAVERFRHWRKSHIPNTHGEEGARMRSSSPNPVLNVIPPVIVVSTQGVCCLLACRVGMTKRLAQCLL